MDWTNYETDAKRGTPRQLLRLRYDMTPDAYEQLQEAFIFHRRYALATAKNQFKQLLVGRCSACGIRHFRKPIEEKYPSGGGFYCHYGWLWHLKYVFPLIWWAGKHGED